MGSGGQCWLQAIPYLAAMLLVGMGLQSRILRRRHAESVDEVYLRFATRWANVADVISLPLVTFLYATASLLTHRTALTEGYWTLLLVLFLFCEAIFVVCAFLTLSSNLLTASDNVWPGVSYKGNCIFRFDVGLRLLKLFGIAVPFVFNMLLICWHD
jgi:hypothetical protein